MVNNIKIMLFLILIGALYFSKSLAATINVKLTLQNTSFFNGPDNMGIGLVNNYFFQPSFQFLLNKFNSK